MSALEFPPAEESQKKSPLMVAGFVLLSLIPFMYFLYGLLMSRMLNDIPEMVGFVVSILLVGNLALGLMLCVKPANMEADRQGTRWFGVGAYGVQLTLTVLVGLTGQLDPWAYMVTLALGLVLVSIAWLIVLGCVGYAHGVMVKVIWIMVGLFLSPLLVALSIPVNMIVEDMNLVGIIVGFLMFLFVLGGMYMYAVNGWALVKRFS